MPESPEDRRRRLTAARVAAKRRRDVETGCRQYARERVPDEMRDILDSVLRVPRGRWGELRALVAAMLGGGA
jgi:hypothetical protein